MRGRRTILLCDLVAGREVGVEVVLAVKGGPILDLRIERNCCPDPEFDAFRVETLCHTPSQLDNARSCEVRTLRAKCRETQHQMGPHVCSALR